MNDENAAVKNEEVTIEKEVEYVIPGRLTRIIDYDYYVDKYAEEKELVTRDISRGGKKVFTFGVVREITFSDSDKSVKLLLFPILAKTKERIEKFKMCFEVVNYTDNKHEAEWVKPAIISQNGISKIEVIKRGVIYFKK